MVGAVGADTYGQDLLDSLGAHGVDVGGVAAAAPLKTGVAVIIVDEPTGQNRIVLSPEANHQGMAPGDFAAAIWPRVMSVAGAQGQGQQTAPDLLVMQLEVPLQTVLQALAAARRDAVPVLLNPAPAVALPAEAYRGLAHLVVNETEAAVLSGLPVARLDTEDGCAEAAAVFARRGVEVVIITLGGRGVYYMASGPAAPRKEEEEVVVVKGLVPAEEVAEVVDTTAAGDTFVGQYALEVVRSRGGEFDVEAAVRKSNRAAALTVQRKGAAASIPWRDEVV
jgi:ribokinase